MKQVLCYGDSNTWGLIPGTNERYDWGVRWTSILQDKLNSNKVHVIEEGLCGRTTVFDDVYRENRNGLKTLPLVLETNNSLDFAIVMLGTNDCKSHYKTNAYKIGKGLEQCLDRISEVVDPEHVLVVSPIHLGNQVWKQEFDPEFDEDSVEVSKQLAREYERVAAERSMHFLAASDYVGPSDVDQEHLSEKDHKRLADVIYEKIEAFL